MKIAHEIGEGILICRSMSTVTVFVSLCSDILFHSSQINVFLNHLNADSIGISVFGIFVIDKNTILTVRF